MTIATDISAANTAFASACSSIEASLLTLEQDQVSDPTTFGKSSGPQAAGGLKARLLLIEARLAVLIRDDR